VRHSRTMPPGVPFARAIHTLPVAVALALPALMAVGCGDEPVTVEGRTLRLRLDEYRIMPQDVRVKAGRLAIVATNVGRLTHNVKIVKRDEDDLEAPVTEIGGTRTAQPGESARETFEDLEPGRYRLACTIANHDDLGQYGELIVEE
jgi:plastocyanin